MAPYTVVVAVLAQLLVISSGMRRAGSMSMHREHDPTADLDKLLSESSLGDASKHLGADAVDAGESSKESVKDFTEEITEGLGALQEEKDKKAKSTGKYDETALLSEEVLDSISDDAAGFSADNADRPVEKVEHVCRKDAEKFCPAVEDGKQLNVISCLATAKNGFGSSGQITKHCALKVEKSIEYVCDKEIGEVSCDGVDTTIVQCLQENRKILSPVCQDIVTLAQRITEMHEGKKTSGVGAVVKGGVAREAAGFSVQAEDHQKHEVADESDPVVGSGHPGADDDVLTQLAELPYGLLPILLFAGTGAAVWILINRILATRAVGMEEFGLNGN